MMAIDVIDRRLAAHPWNTIFFAVFALFFYTAMVFGLASFIWPNLTEIATQRNAESVQIIWLLQVIVQLAIFAHVSYWAESVGAGPLAGRVKLDMNWALIGVIGAPILFIVSINLAASLFANGDPNWAYRDDFDYDTMNRQALGLLMFTSVILLAPMVEEVIYRGVVIGYLLGRGVPALMTVAISALGFTALHMQYTVPALIAIFTLGLFLGWLRLASKSILPPILAHMAVNLYSVITLALNPA